MNKIKLLTIVAVLLFSFGAYADDAYIFEEGKIVEFKGFKGEWISNSSSEKIEQLINTRSTGLNDVIDLNGRNYKKENRIFIPYKDVYLEYLKSRLSVNPISAENEFIWPIEKFDRITSTFGRRWSAFHEGIDIPAGRGVPIYAVCDGKVTTSKFLDNYGNSVFIEHRDNIFTRYCHASELVVKEGDIVKKGDLIAYVGSTGNSTGNHLHFEIRYGDFPLNPLDFLPFNPNVKKAQYIKKID
jgi:murein DD-endopeptidase MepM/ murein hydrolase activator NlpD